MFLPLFSNNTQFLFLGCLLFRLSLQQFSAASCFEDLHFLICN